MATYPSDLPTICVEEPADLANCAPLPIFNSILCISIPTGMSDMGMQLPILISFFSPDITWSPAFKSFGAKI